MIRFAVGTVVAVVDMGGERKMILLRRMLVILMKKVFAESEIQKGNQESIETKRGTLVFSCCHSVGTGS